MILNEYVNKAEFDFCERHLNELRVAAGSGCSLYVQMLN